MKDAREDADHPVGTGAGAVAGGSAGAIAGTAVGGLPGTVIGAVAGAIAGGLAGRRIAESIDPAEEEGYWREEHPRAAWDTRGRGYEAYAPGYRAGWEGRAKYDGRAFDEIEDDLAADYERFRGNDMTWEEVRPAARAAWDRVDRRVQDLTRN